MFTWVLADQAPSTVILVPNLSEGADRVGGQPRGQKECPFSGVTKSGRVWRKVPQSDARSVISTHSYVCFHGDERATLPCLLHWPLLPGSASLLSGTDTERVIHVDVALRPASLYRWVWPLDQFHYTGGCNRQNSFIIHVDVAVTPVSFVCVCASLMMLIRYRTTTLPTCHSHSHSHTFLKDSHRHQGCSSVHVL